MKRLRIQAWVRRRAIPAALAVVLASPIAAAQTSSTDLGSASLEQLMNLQVTSVSRMQERAVDVAAAVFVITADQIRRSGAMTLPEVLRLAPGVQVARVNANQWAVTARGFNDLYASKLLVLVDGRSVYNPVFSGVFWDAENVPLDQIDRIEVIRGPGASIWGANAVNAVINIVTKKAADTQGAYVRAGGGTGGTVDGGARYGGRTNGTAYRLYSEWSEPGRSTMDGGGSGLDASRRFASGFRVDAQAESQSLTVHGDFSSTVTRPLWIRTLSPMPAPPTVSRTPSTSLDGNFVADWTITRPAGGIFEAESFATISHRDDPGVIEREAIYDVQAQYHQHWGRNAVVFGGALRHADARIEGGFWFSLAPGTPRDQTTASMFAHDDVTLGRLTLTGGLKLERTTITGWAYDPTVRGLVRLPHEQRVWAAVSRALRTPSLIELGMASNFAAFYDPHGTPVVMRLVGNPSYRAEEANDVEAGYRVEFGTRAALDVALFDNSYDKLRTQEPLTPFFEPSPAPGHVVLASEFQNRLKARTSGVEVSGQWQPLPQWRLEGSYSTFHFTDRRDGTSLDPETFDGNAPSEQWQLHSTVHVAPRTEATIGLYHSGRLAVLDVPAYTRLDARVKVKVSANGSLALFGENLESPSHVEYTGAATGLLSTRIPRRVRLDFTWQF